MSKTKTIILTVVMALLVASVPACLIVMNKAELLTDHKTTSEINGFYREEEDSLDGIYLGSSPVARSWIPTKAFENYGFCIYCMGTPNQPFITTKYLIEEALKTQKNMKVIFIDIRCLVRPVSHTNAMFIEQITDGMKLSSTRTDMIDAYLEFNNSVGADVDQNKANYLYPVIRDNMAWLPEFRPGDLKALFFDSARKEYKGFNPSMVVEPQEEPDEFLETAELEDFREEELRDLLDYCKGLDCDVVFTSMPMAGMNLGGGDQLRTALLECQDEGFTVLDFNVDPLQSDIDMDWKTEFYNIKHMNYWGALKFTEYLSKWIDDNYSMPDHRNDEDYESWSDTDDRLADYIEMRLEEME